MEENVKEEVLEEQEEKVVKKEKHKKEKKNKDKEKIKELEKQIEELTEKIKYHQAELINYRKRKDEEMVQFRKYCNQDIILEFIGVIDNFERAINIDTNNVSEDVSKFLEGFRMMYLSMKEILKNYGVEEINRVGEIFDSSCEQALMTDDVKDHKEDEVLEVLLKGYKLKDRVIRPASVKINKKKEGEDNNE